MRRYRLPLLLMGVLLLLSACSRQTLLIVTDQYWRASELDGARFSEGLRHIDNRLKVKTSIVTIPYGPNATAQVVGELSKSRSTLVLLSPLYSPEGMSLAARFPGKRLIAFESPGGGSAKAGNLTRLVSDPSPAFREAALRVAEYLTKSSRGGIARIAAVFSDDLQGQAARAGFQSGLDSLSSPPLVSTFVVAGSTDRSRLGRFLQDAEAKGTALYLLAAPTLNAYAIDLLKNDRTPIVTENWNFDATYSEKVLFSIDEDIASAIMKTVETMGRASDNEIRVPWDIVVAPSQS